MSIRVLLVDDEQSFVEILSKRLELRDFEVTAGFSGEAAVRLLEEQDFDVILLDVLMPGKGGIDTLKEIMENDPFSHIIMLTGHARVDTAIEGMKLGAYDYLIKPVEIEALVEKIKLANDHKAAQKARQQKKMVPAGRKRRGWGKLISPVYDLFHKDQRTQSKAPEHEDIETDKDGS
jgi:DNA-binding NtrC family response regulator